MWFVESTNATFALQLTQDREAAVGVLERHLKLLLQPVRLAVAPRWRRPLW